MKTKVLTWMQESKILHYIVILIISLLLFWPLLSTNIVSGDDGYLHLARVIGVDKIIQEGSHFPPMISSLFCEGFGYAINLFYPPLVTFVPLLIKMLVNSYTLGLKLFTLITIFLSGIAMYAFTQKVTRNRLTALISATLYITAPYHLTDIYTRFAIGEFAAFMFIPLVFLGLYNLLEENGKKHYYIAIGAIGLVLTHSITLFYTAIFSAVYLLFYLPKLKEKQVLLKCFGNAGIILAVTAFFTIPIVENMLACDYVIFDTKYMLTNVDWVYQHAIEPSQLFITPEEEELNLTIGIPLLISNLLIFFTYSKMEEKDKKTVLVFILFGTISVLMCTKFFFWRILPNLFANIQYPWRMLGFASFFLGVVGAINIQVFISYIFHKDAKTITFFSYLILAMMTLAVLPMANSYRSENLEADNSLVDSILQNETTNVHNINREYLPVKTYQDGCKYIDERPNEISIVLQGNVKKIEEKKENLTYTLTFEKDQEITFLELPYLYYLGYRIEYRGDTGKTEIIPYTESEHGFIQIELPKEMTKGSIQVTFEGTLLTKVAYGISAISLLGFIIWIIHTKLAKKEKKSNNSIADE